MFDLLIPILATLPALLPPLAFFCGDDGICCTDACGQGCLKSYHEVQVDVSGITDRDCTDCGVLNGSFVLTFFNTGIGTCIFRVSGLAAPCALGATDRLDLTYRGDAENNTVIFSGGNLNGNIWSSGTFDCAAPVTFTLTSTSTQTGCFLPTTVTVTKL